MCVANYLERQFLRNLIVKYKTLSALGEDSTKGFRGQNRIDYLVGEYADVVMDVLTEGGSLSGIDSVEVANTGSGSGPSPGSGSGSEIGMRSSLGDVVVHSTLYEELKESRAAVIEALLSTSVKEDNASGNSEIGQHSNESNDMEVTSTLFTY